MIWLAQNLDLLMVGTVLLLLLAGYPVAFTLAGTALFYAGFGIALGAFDAHLLSLYPSRIFDIVTNEVLIAVPLFILMGSLLEKSKIAEDLLSVMGDLFGQFPGGLGYAVTIVGALLAASTGIVGATVVTMGLLALPTMLKREYDPALATGSIAAAGTLGQIIPPSIVLILLGEAMSNAYSEAQREQGLFATETVSVGDLFAGALIPGLLLVGFYLAYQLVQAIRHPDRSPPAPSSVKHSMSKIVLALLAPLALIFIVLGSILSGISTPTDGAAVGACGALMLAGLKLHSGPKLALSQILILLGVGGAMLLVLLNWQFDLRLGRENIQLMSSAAQLLATMAIVALFIGLIAASKIVAKGQQLQQALSNTSRTTAMVFFILIGATLFSLIFRGLGGDERISELLAASPGGLWGALAIVMILMFLLGFFLDFIEITFIVIPLVAPPLILAGADPIWLGVLFAINLQTSFLTPPFGFALFYLRGTAAKSVSTMAIYKGALPFVAIQIIVLILIALWADLATWLPNLLYR